MRIEEWFAQHIPSRWGARAIEVLADPDEILVIVDLDGKGDAAAAITHFRDSTREERMVIAAAA